MRLSPRVPRCERQQLHRKTPPFRESIALIMPGTGDAGIVGKRGLLPFAPEARRDLALTLLWTRRDGEPVESMVSPAEACSLYSLAESPASSAGRLNFTREPADRRPLLPCRLRSALLRVGDSPCGPPRATAFSCALPPAPLASGREPKRFEVALSLPASSDIKLPSRLCNRRHTASSCRSLPSGSVS